MNNKTDPSTTRWCGGCRHWLEQTPMNFIPDKGRAGGCHRHPPSVTFMVMQNPLNPKQGQPMPIAAWTPTVESDFCGEFEPVEGSRMDLGTLPAPLPFKPGGP